MNFIILEALRNNKHIVAMEVMKGWINRTRFTKWKGSEKGILGLLT